MTTADNIDQAGSDFRLQCRALDQIEASRKEAEEKLLSAQFLLRQNELFADRLRKRITHVWTSRAAHSPI